MEREETYMTELKTLDEVVNSTDDLYESIRNILLESRNRAYKAVNSAMVMAYWTVGKTIVDHEQDGNFRSEYGKKTIVEL